MIELTGTVSAIEKENNNGNDKKVVTLKIGDRQVAFIEFQGRAIDKVWEICSGEIVAIKVCFNGKVSKLGRRYNNLIGKSIRLVK